MVKFELEWTNSAKNNLQKIFLFYCKIASKEVAFKIIEPIFDFVKTLEHSPKVGQEESLLKHLKKQHRYLVFEHFKIIYVIKGQKIYITHVFDTRQNPSKLK